MPVWLFHVFKTLPLLQYCDNNTSVVLVGESVINN